MNTASRFLLIEFIVVAGFALSIGYHYQVSVHTHAGFPLSTIVDNPRWQFADFYREVNQSSAPFTQATRDCIYPPFIEACVNFVFVRVLGHNNLRNLTLFLTIMLVLHTVITRFYVEAESKLETWRRVLILTCCNYPFIFALNLGNFELLMFAFLAGFVYAVRNSKWTIANFLVAVLLNSKPFTIMLLPIYLAHRRWKDLLWLALISAALFGVGTLYYGPNVTQTLHQYGCTLTPCTAEELYTNVGVQSGCSLLGLVRVITAFVAHPFNQDILYKVDSVYVPLAAIAGVAMALYMVLVERQLWRQILIAAALMCLLPPFAFDYRMYYLFLAMLMFVSNKQQSIYDKAYCVLFALLLIPKGFVHFEPIDQNETDQVVINPILMLALIGVAVADGLRSRRSLTMLAEAEAT